MRRMEDRCVPHRTWLCRAAVVVACVLSPLVPPAIGAQEIDVDPQEVIVDIAPVEVVVDDLPPLPMPRFEEPAPIPPPVAATSPSIARRSRPRSHRRRS